MKIRDKITLSFSLMASITVLVFGFIVYFFSDQYRKNEFFNRLIERVTITEEMFLEKDNFLPADYERIRRQFMNRLPDETEEVVLFTPKFRDSLRYHYPASFLAELADQEQAYFDTGDRQGAGRVFHLKGGNYIVLLTAVDRVGIKMESYLITLMVLSLALCVISIGVISYIISGQMLKPISEKVRKANAISARNLHERLSEYDSDDEIGELAIAFNKMLDRLSAAFEAQKSFIDNASHEIRNPLTAIMGETEVALEKQRTNEEYVDSLRSISAEADRLNTLVNNLLNLATISYRDVSFKSELIDVEKLLRDSKSKFDFSTPDNQVAITFALSRPVFVKGNAHLLQTAFINVFDNATKFSFSKPVTVHVTMDGRDRVNVIVLDQGLGIPDEDLAKVTIPFHRAPNVRKILGTGIGIPLTVKIIELHQGVFEISSTLNVGTEVRIWLPVQG